MQAYDSKVLSDRLTDLAEVYDKKPVSEKGLMVWFNLLREFPTERVCGVLIGWPKTHTKFPAPSEIWKLVNDLGIGEREKKASEENKLAAFEAGVGGEHAEQFIAHMRKVLKGPLRSPREHWEHILKTANPGSIGYQYASEVLMKQGALTKVHREREPGEDDEAVNF